MPNAKTNLVIVESPSKAKTIGKYLGPDYQVKASMGHLRDLRSTEVVLTNGGVGYRFNADGNQVSYKCDVRRVTTINYDRNIVREYAANLNQKSNEVSSAIDRCVVTSDVDYIAPFDVNDSFAGVFDAFCQQ